MDYEKILVKFLKDKTNFINGEIILFEEAPSDEDMVLIETRIVDEVFSCKKDNFYSALQGIRK